MLLAQRTPQPNDGTPNEERPSEQFPIRSGRIIRYTPQTTLQVAVPANAIGFLLSFGIDQSSFFHPGTYEQEYRGSGWYFYAHTADGDPRQSFTLSTNTQFQLEYHSILPEGISSIYPIQQTRRFRYLSFLHAAAQTTIFPVENPDAIWNANSSLSIIGCHQSTPNCNDVQCRIEFNRQGQGRGFFYDPPSGIRRAHLQRYTDLRFDFNTVQRTATLLTPSTRASVNSTISDSDPFSMTRLYSDGYYRAGLIYMKKLKFLDTLDPLGYPEIGENEFVFKEINNDVVLKVPVGAECAIVVGPYFPIYFPLFGIDGLRYYAERIRWECPSIPFGAYSPRWGWASLTDELFIAAQSSDGDVGLKYVAATLPEYNGFGRHTITMHFVDQRRGENFLIGEASLEIFFPATGYRHPPGGNSEPPGLPIPNWFYYYWRTMGSPAVVFTELGDPNSNGYYNLGDPYVHIRNTSSNYEKKTMPLFAKRIGQCPQGHPTLVVKEVDRLTIYGIHAFAKVVYHEFGHKWSYESGILGRRGRPGDSDGDGLLDAWEAAHSLCPFTPDTTDAYAVSPSDTEVVADVIAYGDLLDNVYLWRYDWSNKGLQFGNPLKRFEAFPWVYHSTGGNTSRHQDLLTEWTP